VITTYENLQNANRSLNTIVFTDGIYGVAKETKAYIRSVLGKGSSQAKAISMFHFKKK
jgi:hypothetical protein